jgi:hypothetical protein
MEASHTGDVCPPTTEIDTEIGQLEPESYFTHPVDSIFDAPPARDSVGASTFAAKDVKMAAVTITARMSASFELAHMAATLLNRGVETCIGESSLADSPMVVPILSSRDMPESCLRAIDVPDRSVSSRRALTGKGCVKSCRVSIVSPSSALP